MTENRSSGDRRGPRRRQRGAQPSSRSQRHADILAGHLTVGRIVGAHGIRGELSVELFTDFPEERFASGQTVLIGKEAQPIEVLSSRPHKNRLLVRFAGVNDRDDADRLANTWIYIPEESAVELDEDTYFVHQIIGLTVKTEQGDVLGTVSDILFTGANEVYVVTPRDGVNRGRELLLPAIADVIQAVDLESGELTVRLLPGLLDESE